MSIKVKHEGNATAAAFASAEGGKGKRAREEAAPMASVMQQAANAGGQQLRGATAQVTSPGRATAPTTHAPTISAPNPPLLRNNLGAMSNNFGATRSGVGMGVNTQKSAGIGASQRGGVENRGMSAQQKMAAMTEQDILDEKLRRMRIENNALQANSEVIEGNERFGEHSPDAQWDPWRGLWIRQKGANEDAIELEGLKRQKDIALAVAKEAAMMKARGLTFENNRELKQMDIDARDYRQGQWLDFKNRELENRAQNGSGIKYDPKVLAEYNNSTDLLAYEPDQFGNPDLSKPKQLSEKGKAEVDRRRKVARDYVDRYVERGLAQSFDEGEAETGGETPREGSIDPSSEIPPPDGQKADGNGGDATDPRSIALTADEKIKMYDRLIEQKQSEMLDRSVPNIN